jgi:dTDP-4-dehydrorhamnose 3,5-epimerase-like enzyme
MKEIIKKVFEAEDGQIFETEELCAAHENKTQIDISRSSALQKNRNCPILLFSKLYKKESIKYKLLKINIFSDPSGDLISFEGGKNIPFQIKRVYTIFNTDLNLTRGFHAHLNSKQLIYVLQGRVDIILDDGTNRHKVQLKNSMEALYIDSIIWREMINFSKDCILVCIVDTLYNEKDYIRNYNDFLSLVRRK